MKAPQIDLTMWVMALAVLTVPLLLLGNRSLLEGLLGVHLPASALMVVVPALVTGTMAGKSGRLRDLLSTAQFTKSDVFVVPVAIAIPTLVIATDQWLQGNAFPDSGLSLALLVRAAVFTVAAVLEETGWNAWLMRGLADRMAILKAALVIGGLWALWHVVPWFRLGHSMEWVTGQVSSTVAIRWLIGELSLLGNRWLWPAVAAHASSNLAWSLTADSGDSYRPFTAAIGYVLVAGVFWIRRRS